MSDWAWKDFQRVLSLEIHHGNILTEKQVLINQNIFLKEKCPVGTLGKKGLSFEHFIKLPIKNSPSSWTRMVTSPKPGPAPEAVSSSQQKCWSAGNSIKQRLLLAHVVVEAGETEWPSQGCLSNGSTSPTWVLQSWPWTALKAWAYPSYSLTLDRHQHIISAFFFSPMYEEQNIQSNYTVGEWPEVFLHGGSGPCDL